MRFLFTLCAIVFALTGSVTQASAADYPRTGFDLRWGATHLWGTLTWHNRNVEVDAQLKAVSGCRTGLFTAYADGLTYDQFPARSCNGTFAFNDKLIVDIPGGADTVYVDLWTDTRVRRAICHRTGCENTSPAVQS